MKLKKSKINWGQYIKKAYIVFAITLFGVGGFVAYMGNSLENPVLIALGFGGLSGGIMLFLSWRRRGDIRHIRKSEEIGDENLEPPNSLSIYPNRIEFAYVEHPQGQSQKCLNDGNYYHVHKINLVDKIEEMVEFRLPDDDESQRYYDPTEFANPVTMPSNKKYFTWSASLMQQISVGVMALVIGGLVIGMIVMGG